MDKVIVPESENNDHYYRFLFNLQTSGITNMYGAGFFLEKTFPELNTEKADILLSYWMKNWHTLSKRLVGVVEQ